MMDDSERREVAKVLMTTLFPGETNHDFCARAAVEGADALIAELDKTPVPDPTGDTDAIPAVRSWVIVVDSLRSSGSYKVMFSPCFGSGPRPMTFASPNVAQLFISMNMQEWIDTLHPRVVRRDAPTSEPDA